MANQIQSPLTEQILTNLQYQGSSNDCAPYTTATVVNAMRGQKLIGDDLAKQMNKPRLARHFPYYPTCAQFGYLPLGNRGCFERL